MKEFKDSDTKINLEIALKGEALAHLKYQFYRSNLSNTSKELENKLDEIIHNEKEHGKIWFKLLHDTEVLSDTINLKDAISGELYEFSEMYPCFAEIAFEEGYDEIGELFLSVADIEGNHAQEFENILLSIDNGSLFKDNDVVSWKCLNCGFIIHDEFEAPEECPVCKHSKKYFIRSE